MAVALQVLLLLLAMSMCCGAQELSTHWNGLVWETQISALMRLGMKVLQESIQEARLCPADLLGRDIVVRCQQQDMPLVGEVTAIHLLPKQIEVSCMQRIGQQHPTLAEDVSHSLSRMLHRTAQLIAGHHSEYLAEMGRVGRLESEQKRLERELHTLAPRDGERSTLSTYHSLTASFIYLVRQRRQQLQAIYDSWVRQTEQSKAIMQQLTNVRSKLVRLPSPSVRLPGSDVDMLCTIIVEECTATHGGHPFSLMFRKQEAEFEDLDLLLPQTFKDESNGIRITIY